MASFLLGVLCGMAIEEVLRYGSRRFDKWEKKIRDLPDLVENKEVEVLKDENNISK